MGKGEKRRKKREKKTQRGAAETQAKKKLSADVADGHGAAWPQPKNESVDVADGEKRMRSRSRST